MDAIHFSPGPPDWPTFVMASSHLRHLDLEPTGACHHCGQPCNPGTLCSPDCTISMARSIVPALKADSPLAAKFSS